RSSGRFVPDTTRTTENAASRPHSGRAHRGPVQRTVTTTAAAAPARQAEGGKARPEIQLSRSTSARHEAGWASATKVWPSTAATADAATAPRATPASHRGRRAASAAATRTTGATTAASWVRPMAAVRAGPGSRPTERARSACMPPRVSVAIAASTTPATARAAPARPRTASTAAHRSTWRSSSVTDAPLAAGTASEGRAGAAGMGAVSHAARAPPPSVVNGARRSDALVGGAGEDLALVGRRLVALPVAGHVDRSVADARAHRQGGEHGEPGDDGGDPERGREAVDPAAVDGGHDGDAEGHAELAGQPLGGAGHPE